MSNSSCLFGCRSRSFRGQWMSLAARACFQLCSKHGIFTQFYFNVGPPSSPLDQHWNSIGWMSRVCWECYQLNDLMIEVIYGKSDLPAVSHHRTRLKYHLDVSTSCKLTYWYRSWGNYLWGSHNNNPANTRRWHNVGLLLGQHDRWRSNIKQHWIILTYIFTRKRSGNVSKM